MSLLHRPQTCDAFNHVVLGGGVGAYNRGALSLNYLDHGFIRRGLGGTLLRWIGDSPLAGCVDELLVFHLLSAIWLTIPLVLLVRRVAARDWRFGVWLALLLVISPQLFCAWGGDIGRVDMFVEGCLAWGVLALLRGWVWAAIASVLFGLLAHENAVIYGVPLLAAVHVRLHRPGLRQTCVLAAAMVGGIVLVLVAQIVFTSASRQDIIDAVLRSQLPSYKRDFAAYIAANGAKGIATSLCKSLGRAATPLFLAFAVAIGAVYAWLLLLRRKEWIPYALITAVPFAATCLVAVDYGRWLTYAVLNGWLFAAAASEMDTPNLSQRFSVLPRFAVLLVLVAMRPSHVHYPSRFAMVLAERIWAPKGTNMKLTDQCDPLWRASIGLPLKPNYPPQ